MDTLTYFTPEKLERLKAAPLPRHIAIIPDGNRRWAKKQGWRAFFGHRQGSQVLVEIVSAAVELKIPLLTLYTFSTENWTRPQEEIASLMTLLKEYLVSQRKKMIEEGVRLRHIGDISAFPSDVQEALLLSEQLTEKGEALTLVLALNYGGRAELTRAMRNLGQACCSGACDPSSITEELLTSYLDTAPYPDPDLVIRAGGEARLSNFLLWQAAYAEIYVSSTFWPDFNPQELYRAIEWYQQREKRFGA